MVPGAGATAANGGWLPTASSAGLILASVAVRSSADGLRAGSRASAVSTSGTSGAGIPLRSGWPCTIR